MAPPVCLISIHGLITGIFITVLSIPVFISDLAVIVPTRIGEAITTPTIMATLIMGATTEGATGVAVATGVAAGILSLVSGNEAHGRAA